MFHYNSYLVPTNNKKYYDTTFFVKKNNTLEAITVSLNKKYLQCYILAHRYHVFSIFYSRLQHKSIVLNRFCHFYCHFTIFLSTILKYFNNFCVITFRKSIFQCYLINKLGYIFIKVKNFQQNIYDRNIFFSVNVLKNQ